MGLDAGDAERAKEFQGSLIIGGAGASAAAVSVAEPAALVLLGSGVIMAVVCTWRRGKKRPH